MKRRLEAVSLGGEQWKVEMNLNKTHLMKFIAIKVNIKNNCWR